MKQETHRKILDSQVIISEAQLEDIIFPLFPGDRIFFSGDLGAGKSTFIRALIRAHFSLSDMIVRSPTYTYYQKYRGQMINDKGQIGSENLENTADHELSVVSSQLSDIYHFDLYRIENPEDLFLIGADDIFADPTSICLIEWPEILGDSVRPTVTIAIEKISDMQRRFTLRRSTV